MASFPVARAQQRAPDLSVRILGTLREGEGLRARVYLDGQPHSSLPPGYTLSWLRGNAPIDAAKDKVDYLLQEGDAGHIIGVRCSNSKPRRPQPASHDPTVPPQRPAPTPPGAIGYEMHA